VGTAELVIGLALIILGFSIFGSNLLGIYVNVDVMLIVGIPVIVVGILLLRNYDIDKKESENS